MPKNNRVQRNLTRIYQAKPNHHKKKITEFHVSSKQSVNISYSTSGTFIMLLMLGACVSSAAGECEPPDGSYLKTCDVKGKPYYSTDPNLKDVAMCKFDLSCKTLDGRQRQQTTLHVQKSMKGCLKLFENCGGKPVVRSLNDRVCEDPKMAELESKRNIDL